MAIRAGSGGLKYPLPSRADINARQSAAAASAGGSASASAFGANRRYALGKRRLAHDTLQSGLDRQFRGQQAFIDREHQKGAQLSAQEHRAALLDKRLAQDADFELQAQQLNLQKQGAAAKQSTHRDAVALTKVEQDDGSFLTYEDAYAAAVRRRQVAGIQSGELEMPKQIQDRINKTDSGLAEFDGLNADQQNEFNGKRDALVERGINSASPRIGANPTLGQRFEGSTITDNGVRYQETDKGFVPLERPVDPQVEQQQVQADTQSEQQVTRRQELKTDALEIMKDARRGEEDGPLSSFKAAYAEAQRRQEFLDTEDAVRAESISQLDAEEAGIAAEAQRIAGIQGQPLTPEAHIARARERLAGGRDRVTAGGRDFVTAAAAAGPATSGYNADAPFEGISTTERQQHLRGEQPHPGMDPETFGKHTPGGQVGRRRTDVLAGTSSSPGGGIRLEGTGDDREPSDALLAKATRRKRSRGRRDTAREGRAATGTGRAARRRRGRRKPQATSEGLSVQERINRGEGLGTSSVVPQVPAGLPEGSQMINGDTIQLPDGRIIRRKPPAKRSKPLTAKERRELKKKNFWDITEGKGLGTSSVVPLR